MVVIRLSGTFRRREISLGTSRWPKRTILDFVASLEHQSGYKSGA